MKAIVTGYSIISTGPTSSAVILTADMIILKDDGTQDTDNFQVTYDFENVGAFHDTVVNAVTSRMDTLGYGTILPTQIAYVMLNGGA